VVTEARRRWAELDEDPEEDRRFARQRRLQGFVRGGLLAVVALGVWIAVSARQDIDAAREPEPTRPRALVQVPPGYSAFGLVEPDLTVAEDSVGHWWLLAEPDARFFGGEWVIAACREPGGREVGAGNGLVTGTLGADFFVDTTDDDGVRTVAARANGVTSAMVIDRRPERLVTVMSSGWDGEPAAVARALFDAAADADDDADGAGCAGLEVVAADAADLPVRQTRQLDVPVLPIGLRLVSADETSVAWQGAAPDASIVLTSQRVGAGGDDADLLAFLRPAGGTEARVVVGTSPGFRADYADGSEQLIWFQDGDLHTLSLGASVQADVVAVASTLTVPDDATWQAFVRSVTG
jgi:hypothetical protein